MKNILRKALVILIVGGTLLGTTANCFGRFPLVRAIYNFNATVLGNSLFDRFLKTILFYVLNIIPVYGICGFLDVVIFNLIEFWTGSNPLAKADFDSEGKLTKVIEKDGQKVRIEYSEFGKRMEFHFANEEGKSSVLVALKDKPNQIFEFKADGSLAPVQVDSQVVGNKMILKKMQESGKMESSKIIKTDDYANIKSTLGSASL